MVPASKSEYRDLTLAENGPGAPGYSPWEQYGLLGGVGTTYQVPWNSGERGAWVWSEHSAQAMSDGLRWTHIYFCAWDATLGRRVSVELRAHLQFS